jgi:hypothetical protein
LLAPDIQEAILDGRQPKGLQLEELTKPMPTQLARAALGGNRVANKLACGHLLERG